MQNIPTGSPVKKENISDKKRRLNNIELSELYPKPKTFDELTKDQEDRETSKLMRLPKHLALSLSTRLFITVGMAALLFTFAPVIVG